MSKIFRTFRFQNIELGKIKKYILYALGEIALIMFGVLLALYISNRNEERKNRVEEKKILSQVVKDLEQDLISFNRDYTKKNQFLTACLSGSRNQVSIDSLSFYIDNYFAFFKTNASYIGLKDGGRLSLIQDEELKTKLITYYEKQYDMLNAFGDFHKSYHNDQIIPMLLDLPKSKDRTVKLNFEKAEGKKLHNVIEYQIGLNELIKTQLQNSKKSANEIIDLISKEN